MKIIFDTESIAYPLTGIGRYALSLAYQLQTSPLVTEAVFLSFEGHLIFKTIEEFELYFEKKIAASKPPSAEQVFTLKSMVLKIRQFASGIDLLRWGWHFLRKWRYKQFTPSFPNHIYHGPNYHLVPVPNDSVVTIHDLSVLRHPECHPVERTSYWEQELHNVAARASHIITVSKFQRAEIIELLDVEPSKVSVVYLGVDETFQPYSRLKCEAVLRKYGVVYKQYSLVVSTIEPRKNFIRLLQAFGNLPEETRLAYPLAIVGDKGWGSDDIHELISSLIEKKQAIRLGYVDETDLPKLYAAASVFIYPSIYEGFGLPVLEAMASGTAVLTSNTSSIPEVAGDACLLVDPCSVDDIAQGWQRLLCESELRDELSRKGLLQSKKFTWQRCAEQTIDVYKGMAS